MALTELIRRKIAVVNETTNTITIGKQKGLLKGVQFEISQKEPAFFKRKAYYKSCSYYAAARLQLDKIIKGEKPIDDLKQYASTIEENWDNGNKWTRPILEINTYQELVLKVTENYDAITEIKGVMSKNYKELAHIAFCEKLMVLYDKSASLKGNAKYKKRLGNDALECLSNLYEYYPDIMEKYNNSSEEITTEDKILEYAPFEFKKSETKFITITKKNITENMYEIEKAIKKGDKKSFKAFRQLSIKKEFYASFFG